MLEPSSPVLKARKQSHKLYSKMLSSIVAFVFSIWLIRFTFFGDDRPRLEVDTLPQPRPPPPNAHGRARPLQLHAGQPVLLNNTRHTPLPLPANDPYLPSKPSLAAVLPVTSHSVSDLHFHLRSLLGTSESLSDLILLSPPPLHAQIRHALRSILSEEEEHEVVVSISPWPEGLALGAALIESAGRAGTDWVLLTDEEGLEHFDTDTRDILLLNTGPRSSSPMGPRGVDYQLACLTPGTGSQIAAYLVPPLVLPTSSLPPTKNVRLDEPWAALGHYVARHGSTHVGGLVTGSSNGSLAWCDRYMPDQTVALLPGDESQSTISTTPNATSHAATGFFLLVAHASQAGLLVPLVCQLVRQGQSATFILLLDAGDAAPELVSHLEKCRVVLHLVPYSLTDAEDVQRELQGRVPGGLDVVISSLDDESLSQVVDHLVRKKTGHPVSVIHIPKDDLPFCDWMSAVDLEGWKNWHTPQIELSVITDHRPHSLDRLLSSLTRARYFGDKVNMRINIEQTADPETQQIIRQYRWEHGSVFPHHRVLHAGLMTAVVESWYPKNNHTYGLLLEDDVEVSPLFYAWARLSLLRYRYGDPENRRPNLFGISLYQQRNLELHPDGRRLFDARSTFAAAGLAHPETPYLSQIPCSWGALYFPEHWREFHAYLAARLNASAWPLALAFDDEVPVAVVPAVRSNRWTRSWKKYFIELVFLRAYVMLYPNYAAHASLSTNHLEVGSHVHDVPLETYLRKKKLFNVPLMPLPRVFEPRPGRTRSLPSTGLLELPDGRLPDWDALPVFDLLGAITNETTLLQRGRERRTELTGCGGIPAHAYDVQELLCND